MEREKIEIYCDGACSGNQYSSNKGGWGAILAYKGRSKEIYGGERNTTNQKMELVACIKALETLKTSKIEVIVYSDSAYLINCMNKKWYKKWQQNGWKNAKKDPVENKILWERLLPLITKYSITFIKVAGHSGVEMNERADELARQGVEELL